VILDIDPEVFTVANQAGVVRLLEMVAEARHDWRPSMAVAVRAGEFVHAHSLRISALAELVAKTVEASAYPAPGPAFLTPVTVDQFDGTVADLQLAAVLVVEDGINEHSFVLGVARAFKRHRIVNALLHTPSWLTICHAGGKDRMHIFVKQRRQDFQVIVRVGALLDSDRKYPQEVTVSNHRQVELIRAVDGVTAVHMWEGQEMENYLPSKVWEHHFPAKASELANLRAMLPHQRAYTDLKVLLGKPKPVIPDDLALDKTHFMELGQDAMDELETLLSMIEEII